MNGEIEKIRVEINKTEKRLERFTTRIEQEQILFDFLKKVKDIVDWTDEGSAE